MSVVDNQADLEALFKRLVMLARKEGRRFSFHEACDFISAMSGMDIKVVRERLIDVDAE